MRLAGKGIIASGLFLAALCFTTIVAAADTVIQGVVNDTSGKPVRGAIVKAYSKGKAVSGFTAADGQYRIAVPAGTYDVSVDAFGYGGKRESKDTSQGGPTNFSLSPRIDVMRLSGAEIEGLLPDNQQTRMIRSDCVDCHTLGTVMLMRGSAAADWKNWLHVMTKDKMESRDFFDSDGNHPLENAALGEALEKYFGPNAPYLGPDADPPAPSQIKHARLNDAVLRSTIREYDIPTANSLPHSIEIDPKSNVAWFTEFGYQGNKAVRFDIDTETFQEYPMLTPRVRPHTGAIGKDGRFWIAFAEPGPAKLGSVNPKTGEVKEYKWPENDGTAHTVRVNREGNIWFSGGRNDELWSFDVATEKFKGYKYPLPSSWPQDSTGTFKVIPGQAPPSISGRSYDIDFDSHGDIWFSEIALGQLARLDPETGQTKEFKPAGTINIRGILVDPNDNVWFSSYFSHKVGRLDPKTGEFKYYQPPTVNATPYGWVRDPKTGYLWFADQSGNNITRLDPKTGEFVEYPIPTRNANPRFIDVDANGRVWFTEFMQSKIGVIDPGEGNKGNKQSASR